MNRCIRRYSIYTYLTSVVVNLKESRITITVTAVASHLLCTHSNRQRSCTHGRKFSLAHITSNTPPGNLCTIAPSRANLLLRYHDAIKFSRNRVNGSEVWTRLCRCGVPVVVEPPTASRRNGTGVLRVMTGTHRWDDPPRQGGESSERQLVQCVVAWVRALWISCEGTC